VAEKVKLDVVFDDDFSAPAKKAGNASQDLAAQMARIERIAKGTSGALSRTEVKLNSMARSVGTASRSLTQFTRRSNLNAKTFASAWSVTATRVPSVMDRLGDSFVGLAGRSRLLRGGLVMAAGAANSMAARGITLTRAVGGINTAFERIAGGGFVRNLGARLKGMFSMIVAGFAAATAAATAFFAYSVFQAGLLRSRMSLAFGSADEFERIKQLSLDMRAPLGATAEQMKRLMNAGFDKGLATTLFKRGQDMMALGASADEVRRAMLAISQIKSAGTLQGDELNQLADATIGKDFVYAALAKNLGKTTEEIIKMKEAGKIKSDDAIQAILDVMTKKTRGKDPGELSKIFNNTTVGGAIKSLTSLASNALDDIAVAAEPAFLAIGVAINDVTTALQSGDADKFKKSIGEAFNATARAIKVVWTTWKQFASGFRDIMIDGGGLAEINKELAGMFGGMDAEGAGFAFAQLGKAAAVAVISLVKLLAIGAAVSVQLAALATVVSDTLSPSLRKAGVDMDTVTKATRALAVVLGIIGLVLVGTTLLALSPLIALLAIVALALTTATAAAYGLIKAFEAISAAAGRAGTAISNAMGSGFGAATIGFGAMPGLPDMPALAGAGGFTGASMGMSSIERGGPTGSPAVVGGAQGMDLSGLASMFTTSGGGEGGGGEKTVNFDFSVNVEGDGASDVEAVWEQLRWRVRREVEVGIKNAGDM
jgi:tape measure domain-containing protein